MAAEVRLVFRPAGRPATGGSRGVVRPPIEITHWETADAAKAYADQKAGETLTWTKSEAYDTLWPTDPDPLIWVAQDRQDDLDLHAKWLIVLPIPRTVPANNPPRWDRDQIATLRADGRTVAEIAEALGAPFDTIKNIVHRLNTPRTPRKSNGKVVDTAEIVRLAADGYSGLQIAAQTGYSPGVVYRRLTDHRAAERATAAAKRHAADLTRIDALLASKGLKP